MKNFNNVTIVDSKYVKVKTIKVEVPYLESDESFVFVSKNKQLIRKHMNWGEWDSTIRFIFYKEKGIKGKDLDCFVDWNISAAKFNLHEFRKCLQEEIQYFKFLRADQRSEILSGNDQIVFKEYIRAIHNHEFNEPTNLIYRS